MIHVSIMVQWQQRVNTRPVLSDKKIQNTFLKINPSEKKKKKGNCNTYIQDTYVKLQRGRKHLHMNFVLLPNSQVVTRKTECTPSCCCAVTYLDVSFLSNGFALQRQKGGFFGLNSSLI